MHACFDAIPGPLSRAPPEGDFEHHLVQPQTNAAFRYILE